MCVCVFVHVCVIRPPSSSPLSFDAVCACPPFLKTEPTDNGFADEWFSGLGLQLQLIVWPRTVKLGWLAAEVAVCMCVCVCLCVHVYLCVCVCLGVCAWCVCNPFHTHLHARQPHTQKQCAFVCVRVRVSVCVHV